MKKQEHKIWRVTVASYDDKKSLHVFKRKGKPPLHVFTRPDRATYMIEAKGQGQRAIKKALQLAAEEGITNAYWTGLEWANSPYHYEKPDFI